MLTNGLLLTLTRDASLADEVLRLVSERGEVVVGRIKGRCLPLAVEVADAKAAHVFHEWLESLDGVERVDVIYVGMEEPPAPVTTS